LLSSLGALVDRWCGELFRSWWSRRCGPSRIRPAGPTVRRDGDGRQGGGPGLDAASGTVL